MSEEQNENSSTPAAKPTAPVAAPEKPVIEPGGFGAVIANAGLSVSHLGVDAIGNEVLGVEPANVLAVATFLRNKCEIDLLLSCSGIDWKDRLESVYHFYSTQRHTYLTVRITAQDSHSPSLTPIYPAADWHERESYDLLGIHYDGHPNLTRILMPNDWLGHPLRKDYKVDDPRLVWNER